MSSCESGIRSCLPAPFLLSSPPHGPPTLICTDLVRAPGAHPCRRLFLTGDPASPAPSPGPEAPGKVLEGAAGRRAERAGQGRSWGGGRRHRPPIPARARCENGEGPSNSAASRGQLGRAHARYLRAEEAQRADGQAGRRGARVSRRRPRCRRRRGRGSRAERTDAVRGCGPARIRARARVHGALKVGACVRTAVPSADFTFISSLAGGPRLSRKEGCKQRCGSAPVQESGECLALTTTRFPASTRPRV